MSAAPAPWLAVDPERCIGSGRCVLSAPAVFDQGDEDGLVRLLDPAPPDALRAGARNAAALCPSGAILVGGAAPQ
ncbi:MULTISPECIES: ferredoxin [Streptacidiphilus]|uniref:Ferredoxin n=1 Tax=Streptacidiphilus cavernicola TaxID=3342716 RepID=A0ABV6UMM2_9ACTN|nr:ferredoxin [Streptacidiphilus jeojiense]